MPGSLGQGCHINEVRGLCCCGCLHHILETVQGTAPIEWGSLQHSGQEPCSGEGQEQCREPVTQTKHSCCGTGCVGARSQSKPAPNKLHARQPPLRLRKSSYAQTSWQNLSQEGQRRGSTHRTAGDGSHSPPPWNRLLPASRVPDVPDSDLTLGGTAEWFSTAEGERKDVWSLRQPGTTPRQPQPSSHPFSWGWVENPTGHMWETRLECWVMPGTREVAMGEIRSS